MTFWRQLAPYPAQMKITIDLDEPGVHGFDDRLEANASRLRSKRPVGDPCQKPSHSLAGHAGTLVHASEQ